MQDPHLHVWAFISLILMLNEQ
uniref:Uncharacterized protein n=1 Tax=Anguilla anguilla TaxID=7936 RepID=A0A0E9UHH2_ANGAN